MNDPIKVIWKYKNNNRRVQYNMYIFIGNQTGDIDPVLNKIEKLNLYDSLIKLNKSEHKQISEKYGERWYEKFFIHITLTLLWLRLEILVPCRKN